MAEMFQLQEGKVTQRSVLSGALMAGSGAVLLAPVSAFAESVVGAADLVFDKTMNPIVQSAAQTLVEIGTDTEGARFTKDFLSNKVFQDCALSFDPLNPVHIEGEILDTGALVQPNGDILFRIYAPKAGDVVLKLDTPRDREVALAIQKDGIFEGTLRYDREHTGPINVDVYVNGMIFLYPFIPIHWTNNRPYNFIEVPDTDMEFISITDVPHGVMSREIYWADALKSWARCIVYTPAGYMKSTKEYPVLYLQHGGGDNENEWENIGRVTSILDNLFAAGKAEPFMIVMNNDMLRYRDNRGSTIDDAFQRMLIENCIPFIEKKYRTKTGKWNRAIGGLSMGSYMSCDIGFNHPELFGSMGTFTASMTVGTNLQTTYIRPYAAVMKDRDTFAENYKVYFRSTTPAEDHFEYFLADDKLCADAGIDKLPSYHRVVYPAQTTKWNSWRKGLRDYAELLFR